MAHHIGDELTCRESDCIGNRVVETGEDRRESLTRSTRRRVVVVKLETYVGVTRHLPVIPPLARSNATDSRSGSFSRRGRR